MCNANCNLELCKSCKNYMPKTSYYQQAKTKCNYYFEQQYGAKQPYCWAPSAQAHEMAKSVMHYKKQLPIKDAFSCYSDVIDYFETYKNALEVFMYHLRKESTVTEVQ